MDNIISRIVDADGVITHELHEGDSIKIMKKEQKDYIAEHDTYFNRDETFVKFYTSLVPYLYEHLTKAEAKLVMGLMPFVKYGDCTLEETVSGHSKVLSMEDIAERLNENYSTIRRLFSSLKSKGVIGVHETGTILPHTDLKVKKIYTVNPYIYFKGRDVNPLVLKFYKESGWDKIIQDLKN